LKEIPTHRIFVVTPLVQPIGPDLADVRVVPLVWISDPADVPCRTVGLDLQSRPIEYKDFQSAKAMN
jgi:hypothetical protein